MVGTHRVNSNDVGLLVHYEPYRTRSLQILNIMSYSTNTVLNILKVIDCFGMHNSDNLCHVNSIYSL